MKFVPFQRVTYVGKSYPTLLSGSQGFVSDIRKAPAIGFVMVDFPECVPRIHEVPERDLDTSHALR